MIRCAIYIRVSHEEQALHGYSLEAQKEMLTRYANESDLVIVDYYIDEALTARKRLLYRKEFQRMMLDIQSGKIDLIIFTKLDRWFRSISDYYKTQEILEKYNVNWKTILENYDTSTASGRLHINIMLSVAQDEADRTSERIKVVFDNKVKNGEAITGAVLPGYKIENKKIVIDKSMEPLIRDLFDYFELHGSATETMRYINAKYNTSYAYAVILRIIRSQQYCGHYRDNNNYCEAYISAERYDKLQRLMKTNQRSRRPNRSYIFAGLIICDRCKKRYSGGLLKNKIGTGYKYYICYNAKINKLCDNHLYLSEKIVEKYLLKNIAADMEKHIIRVEAELYRRPMIDNSKEINRKLERLKNLYVNEKITMEEYCSDYDKIKSELIVVEDNKSVNLESLKKFLQSDFLAGYERLNDIQKRALWRSVIDKIIVDGKTIKEVIFI